VPSGGIRGVVRNPAGELLNKHTHGLGDKRSTEKQVRYSLHRSTSAHSRSIRHLRSTRSHSRWTGRTTHRRCDRLKKTFIQLRPRSVVVHNRDRRRGREITRNSALHWCSSSGVPFRLIVISWDLLYQSLLGLPWHIMHSGENATSALGYAYPPRQYEQLSTTDPCERLH
jgi:hypothetical protein